MRCRRRGGGRSPRLCEPGQPLLGDGDPASVEVAASDRPPRRVVILHDPLRTDDERPRQRALQPVHARVRPVVDLVQPGVASGGRARARGRTAASARSYFALSTCVTPRRRRVRSARGVSSRSSSATLARPAATGLEPSGATSRARVGRSAGDRQVVAACLVEAELERNHVLGDLQGAREARRSLAFEEVDHLGPGRLGELRSMAGLKPIPARKRSTQTSSTPSATKGVGPSRWANQRDEQQSGAGEREPHDQRGHPNDVEADGLRNSPGGSANSQATRKPPPSAPSVGVSQASATIGGTTSSAAPDPEESRRRRRGTRRRRARSSKPQPARSARRTS